MISGSASQIHLEAKIYTHIPLVPRSIFRRHSIPQLPVIVLVPVRTGIVDGPSSTRKRRPFGAIPMFFSSPIRPPDLSSQFLILFPISSSSESSISIAPASGSYVSMRQSKRGPLGGGARFAGPGRRRGLRTSPGGPSGHFPVPNDILV
jgi:Sec-independent protein secretion pathway component TatC